MSKVENHIDLDGELKRTLVLVMAGGQGSRLGQLTKNRSKPAVEFGGNFKIIDFVMSNCINSNLKRIGVLTQYKSHCLIRHLFKAWGYLNQGSDSLMEVLPAAQQCGSSWYQGTADACFQNIGFLEAEKPAHVMILSGDHIYKQDYREFLACHIRNDAELTVSCQSVPVEDAAGQFGVMSVNEEDRITKFEEKPLHPAQLADQPGYSLASMGNYIFDYDFLLEQLKHDSEEEYSNHDFGKDILPRLMASKRVYVYRFAAGEAGKSNYWRDVGTLDSYWQAHMDLLNPQSGLDLHDPDWPVWTWQPPHTPTLFDTVENGSMCVLKQSILAAGCSMKAAVINQSLISVGCCIQENAHISNSVLLPDVQVGEGVRLNRAIVDNGCSIPNNMSIGFDDFEEKSGYFQISPKGIVIVTQEGINNWMKDIDKRNSSETNSHMTEIKHQEYAELATISVSARHPDYQRQVEYSGTC